MICDRVAITGLQGSLCFIREKRGENHAEDFKPTAIFAIPVSDPVSSKDLGWFIPIPRCLHGAIDLSQWSNSNFAFWDVSILGEGQWAKTGL